ncbi:class I SAM-dependent methyltransferase [Patescibacteria group bacterium]|nr:class I SAM-dependent methyltransferase [Patescibacteria group bacterium]MCL5410094.1 class I SAM-dependent methyltransferase [Patescibacteria group bacterium]
MENVPSFLRAEYEQYPWLRYQPETITTYLPPDYYDKLLKPYTSGGASDLDFFIMSIRGHIQNPNADMLEMGSGSGRATDALLASGVNFSSLDLVDMSRDMVAQNRKKYARIPSISVVESDILDYLQATDRMYSYAFSLWGFSYSVHHHMNSTGIRAGAAYAENVITKFVTQNLREGGSIFIVHPDILSDEQRILKSLRQPTVSRTKDRQSSSKRTLDATTEKLERIGIVKAECVQIKGDPICYSSRDEALEVFLNFHMHGSLNRSRKLPRALQTLNAEFDKYQQGDKVLIAPGWFNYTITFQGQ